MPHGCEEPELIAAVARGQAGAFERLVACHRDRAWRVIRVRVADDRTAEDALQETFLGAWRGAAGFRGEASVRGWILGMARRQAARTWRRHVGEPVVLEPMESLGVAAGWGGDDPERAACRAEEGDRVRAALQHLAPEDREVIVLRDLEGLSAPEAAAALEMSVPALKSRLHRARLRLMALLRDQEVTCDA